MNIFKYIPVATALLAGSSLFSSCSDKEEIIEIPVDSFMVEDGTARVKATNLTIPSLANLTIRPLDGFTGNPMEPTDNLACFCVAWSNEEDALSHGFIRPYGDKSEPMAFWEVTIPCRQYNSWDGNDDNWGDERFSWIEPYNKIFSVLNNRIEFSYIPDENITTTSLTFPDGTQKTLSASNPVYVWDLNLKDYMNGLYPDRYDDWKVNIVSNGKNGNKIYEKRGEIKISLNPDYLVEDGKLYHY